MSHQAETGNTFELRVSREEIAAAFDRFVHRRRSVNDMGWKWLTMKKWLRRMRSYHAHRRLQGSDLPQREQEQVIEQYAKEYGDRVPLQKLDPRGKTSPCVWGRQAFIASSIGLKRVHELLLSRALEEIAPESVLEVGCGTGVNLFVLSSHFPELRFHGVELSQQGVDAALRIRDLPELPRELAEFAGDLLVDPTAYKRVEVQQGNAKALPFPDDHFDVLYTVLALEAMEEIRHQALRELSRVARRFVIMVEPFRDHNSRGGRYYHHAQHNYFGARVEDLPLDGLEPVCVYSDFPKLLRLWPAFVVARPAEPSGVRADDAVEV